jgi:hypothetical protein
MATFGNWNCVFLNVSMRQLIIRINAANVLDKNPHRLQSNSSRIRNSVLCFFISMFSRKMSLYFLITCYFSSVQCFLVISLCFNLPSPTFRWIGIIYANKSSAILDLSDEGTIFSHKLATGFPQFSCRKPFAT